MMNLTNGQKAIIETQLRKLTSTTHTLEHLKATLTRLNIVESYEQEIDKISDSLEELATKIEMNHKID